MAEKQSIPEASATTRLLHARLAKCLIGETVPYPELSEIAKRDIQKNRGFLDSARRMAMRIEGFVFGAVSGVGLKRLNDSGIADAVSTDFKKIHRSANRGIRKAEKISDITSLPPDRRTHFLATASCLAAIAHASRNTTLNRIGVTVEKTQAKLPLEQTIEAFR